MTLDAGQVRAARAAGYAAGYALRPASPNPYAPTHVPAWRGPRTAAAVLQLAVGERRALLLALVWRAGYRAGLAAYGRDHQA